ncbi:MAG: NUDIX domain-containing protein [Rhodopseudomonas sp.]|nr:NUDIX domain-containing protein [Rhodopseudomonas sp.]
MTTDLGPKLTDRMTNSERDQSFPDSEPRDASTLMLIDRSGAKPKVLLGRRHHSHKFMPGKFVFPGGRIEALDRAMAAISELHPDTQTKLTERVATPSADLARGLALAAVREVAEETGLLLGVKRDQPPKTPGEIWEEFARHSVHPDLGQIHFIARAITPPRRPKRFDTRFFTADATAIAATIEGVVGPDSELVELTWVPIEEATRLDMPTITGVVLEELGSRVAAGMAQDLPVPFYYMADQKFHRDLL